MELVGALLVLCITMIMFTHNWRNVEGRYHHHPKKQKSPIHNHSPPSVPSKPHPKNLGLYASGPVFVVTSIRAVGDGAVDDTAAFMAAWKAACAVDSWVVIAPENHRFKITSTMFCGPCKPGLVFQVDGVLMPPEGPDSWLKKDSRNQWLVFYKLDQMTFNGIGIIEGNGQKWWELLQGRWMKFGQTSECKDTIDE